jgi:Anti-anti-sigma regulatory factor (antagonist of anti-sigma factor)
MQRSKKMKMTITKTALPIPIVILHLEGTLDGSNFNKLIEKAQTLFANGARDLILDLTNLAFISSSGLGALHQVALLFKGKNHTERDESWASYRWATYRNIKRDHDLRRQEHVKLLSPSKEVREVLDMVGFDALFEIYSDMPQALNSFREPASLDQPGMR